MWLLQMNQGNYLPKAVLILYESINLTEWILIGNTLVGGGMSTNITRPEDKENFTLLLKTLRGKT